MRYNNASLELICAESPTLKRIKSAETDGK